MHNTDDLRKIVTSEPVSKTAITDLIRSVSNAAMPEASKRTVLVALSDAFVAISKSDEAAAAAHVQKARVAIQRSGTGR